MEYELSKREEKTLRISEKEVLQIISKHTGIKIPESAFMSIPHSILSGTTSQVFISWSERELVK